MKSVLITILLFASVLLAIRFNDFEVMSGRLAYYVSSFLLITVLLIAVKVIGNPFGGKDDQHEKK